MKHLRFWRLADSTQTVISRVSTVEIYLDSTSSLPTGLAFSAHSDRDMNTDVAGEIRFSDLPAGERSQRAFDPGQQAGIACFLYLPRKAALIFQFSSR